MGMLFITGIWSVILIGIFVIGLVIDKLILKRLDAIDKEQEDGNDN